MDGSFAALVENYHPQGGSWKERERETKTETETETPGPAYLGICHPLSEASGPLFRMLTQQGKEEGFLPPVSLQGTWQAGKS